MGELISPTPHSRSYIYFLVCAAVSFIPGSLVTKAMNHFIAALLICSVVELGAAVQDLSTKYPFTSVLLDLNDQYYALHWNFTRSTKSIYFAVNVSTTGWVGFGLSPNGQMPGSDVVIGWVADGTGYLHVSKANKHAIMQAAPIVHFICSKECTANS